jgi:hypothetical protein
VFLGRLEATIVGGEGGTWMACEVSYSPRERAWLWILSVIGFVGLNGVFVYGLLRRSDDLISAMTNPVAAAFMVEALVLTGVFAYLLAKWGVSRLHWGWFVALSLVGGMAFALPVVLLWTRPQSRPGDARRPA